MARTLNKPLFDVAIGVSTGTLVELVPGAFGKGVANGVYRYVATAADGPAACMNATEGPTCSFSHDTATKPS